MDAVVKEIATTARRPGDAHGIWPLHEGTLQPGCSNFSKRKRWTLAEANPGPESETVVQTDIRHLYRADVLGLRFFEQLPRNLLLSLTMSHRPSSYPAGKTYLSKAYVCVYVYVCTCLHMYAHIHIYMYIF